ncbi:MBL fold metallo-hydrolase [Bittarella sp. HCP28S3_D9]|uniref:MBL fold metallo-hydrolase n=1 Tax=Bittarella sp. HCP28S3_D9 TaxID=3440253 RepID=UPI003F8B7850
MLRQLTPHVFVMKHNHDTDRPALGLIAGKTASLVVDGGNSPAHARTFLQGISALGVAAPRYLALTHWHWDHVFGAPEMGLTTLANRRTQPHLLQMAGYTWDDDALARRVAQGEEIAFCAENIKREFGAQRAIAVQGADILFDQTLTVELGGLTCQLIHLGGEHSEDSTVVYCPQEGVLFLGDGLCQEMFHGEWSYDLADYRARIDKIKDLPCRFYVNSHWDVQDADEFTAYYRRLIALGELAGESTDPADALGRYRRAHGCDPDEETEGDLLSFVHGNRKRQAAKKGSQQ